VKYYDHTRIASARRLVTLLPLLALAPLGCRKDVTSPNAGVKLAFTVQPSNTIVDSSIVPAVVVTVEDANGTVASGSSALVTIAFGANPGGANLTGTATVGAVAGVATFPYLSLNLPGTGYTLAATATNLTGATSTAFNVMNATTGSFASVTMGGSAACGVTTAGAAYCWGNNVYGLLGNGSTTNAAAPAKVAGGLTFGSVSIGTLQYFACGLTTAGAAYCWGYNDWGQLGSGNLSNSPVPVAVTGNLTFTALSAGAGGQACGLASGGAAYCWGYNGSGQLGTSVTAFSSTPLPVSGGLSFTSISAGENGTTCGIATGGTAYCWGYNGHGEIGNGSLLNSYAPAAVSGGLVFSGVSAGYSSTCGVATGGAAWCWGANPYGELGNGSTTNSATPVRVGGGLTFSAVSAGDGFACGLTTAGAAFCWGYNARGQLGNGATNSSSTPVPVIGGLTFASISAGYSGVCAVTPGGAAYCWGDNAFGQLGTARTGSLTLRPVLVATPP